MLPGMDEQARLSEIAGRYWPRQTGGSHTVADGDLDWLIGQAARANSLAGRLDAETCGECGVQVLDMTAHRRWHDQLSREVLRGIREQARHEGRPTTA